MRPYLSDRQARITFRATLLGMSDPERPASREAEAEARRILADVEQQVWTGGGRLLHTAYVPLVGVRQLRDRRRKGTAADACAESLTAFLAAPDPAAYLRGKQ